MKSDWRDMLVLLLLAAAIFGAFGGITAHGYLLYDDRSVLVDNPHLQEPSFSGAVALFSEVRDEAYLPLWYLAYFPEASLAPGSSAAVHTAALAWHLLCAWLVYLLGCVLLQQRTAGFAAALLFAVHPLTTESVAWASGRKDQVSLAFLLLALLAALRCWRRPHGQPWLAAVLIFAGSFAKGTMVVAPLLAAVLFFAERQRIAADGTPALHRERRARTALPLLWCAAALPALFHTLIAWQQGTAGSVSDFGARAWLGAAAWLRYLQHAVLPSGLSIHAAEPQFSWITLLSSLAVLAAFVVGAWRLRKSQPHAAALLLWAPLALLPFNNVFPATSLWFADRYAIIALSGLCLLTGWLLTHLPRVIALLLLALLCAVLLLLTRHRAAEFKDDTTLFSAAAALEPEDAVIPAQLAEALLGPASTRAQQTEALSLLRQALTLAETRGGAVLRLRLHVRLGDLLLASGQAVEALPHHRKALQLATEDMARARSLGLDFTSLHANHAAGLVATGAMAAARDALAEGQRAAPGPALSVLLGRLQLREAMTALQSSDVDAIAVARQKVEQSLALLLDAATTDNAEQAALALRERGEGLLLAAWIPGRYAEVGRMVDMLRTRFPTRSDGWLLSSRLREEGGDRAGALRDLLTALSMDVREVALFSRAAHMLLASGENRKAVEILRAGLRVDPESALLRADLANVLLAQSARHLNASDAAHALQAAEEALRLVPGEPEAQVASGDALAALGRWDAAQRAWTAALKIDATHAGAKRGMARFLQGRGISLLADLQRVLRETPEQDRAAKEQELRDRVMADYRRALELGGDWDQLSIARRYIDEAAAKERRATGTELQERARASLAAGRAVEALELARSAVAADGTSPAGQFLLARMELRSGTEDAALKALQAVIALDPAHLGAQFAAAQIHARKGESPAALRCAEAFLRGARDNAALADDVRLMRELIERMRH